jgi:hypothetical protein
MEGVTIMIILPDRNIPRAKFLMPVSDKEWRESSQSCVKDEFGNQNTTVFHIYAKTNDGVVMWRGCFEDRADFDAFLSALALGTLKQEKSLWNLPTPNWQPYLGDVLTYEFYTTTFISGNAGSGNQTYSKPVDWNNADNYVEAIGAGGGGGCGYDGWYGWEGVGSGGGGGEFRRITNLTLSGNATYAIGAGGANAGGDGGYGVAYAGGDTYFNGTTGTGSSLYAKPGAGGSWAPTAAALSGGAGGSGGIGSAANASGGSGGNTSSSYSVTGTGGGGAAGPGYPPSKTSTPMNGISGVDSTAYYVGTPGGNGNNGYGGAGGNSSAGGNGNEYGSGFGSGGGGGGGIINGYAGGNYGGGGGGYFGYLIYPGAKGGQGLIIVNYAPAATGNKTGFNMPMLGM